MTSDANLSKHVRIVKVLGKGEFGCVYLGESLQTGKAVAIKCFTQQRTLSKYGIEAVILREVILLKKLSELADQNKSIQIARLIELVPGSSQLPIQISMILDFYPFTLRQTMTMTISYQQIQQYMFQMFRSLVYIHGAGIWHRDLKPENIMLNEQRTRCYLVDFGLGRMKSAFRIYTHHVGTCDYRPHELFYDMDRYDGAGLDIWSLGVIWLELLDPMHKCPWFAETELGMLKKMYSILGMPIEFPEFHRCLATREERLADLCNNYYDTAEPNSYFDFAKESHSNQYKQQDDAKNHEAQQAFAQQQLQILLKPMHIPEKHIESLAQLFARIFDFNFRRRITAIQILENYRKLFETPK